MTQCDHCVVAPADSIDRHDLVEIQGLDDAEEVDDVGAERRITRIRLAMAAEVVSDDPRAGCRLSGGAIESDRALMSTTTTRLLSIAST